MNPVSLHTQWAQKETAAQVSPVFETLLNILKNRFRVAGVIAFVMQEGTAVLNMSVGQEPSALDCTAALAMCVGQPDQLYAVEDSHDNPHIENTSALQANSTGLPVVRFYAGAPLTIKPDGQAIGMLCLFDIQPRGFSRADRLLLKALGNAISTMLLMPHNPSLAVAIALQAEKSMLVLGEAQMIEAVNPRFSKLASLTVDDLKRTGVDDLLCLDRPSSGAVLISHALLAEVPAHGITRCHTKGGETFPVEVFVFPLTGLRGRVVKTLLLMAPLYSGPVEDFLLSLRANERSELLSLHIAGLWSVDKAGRIDKLSGAPTAHLSAIAQGAVKGKRLDNAGIFDALQSDWTAFYKSLADGNLPDEVECCVTHNGHRQWFSMIGFRRYDARGCTQGYHGSFRDITRRKLKENALRKAEERQRLILQGTNDGAWDWDMESGDYYLSPRWWAMMGRDPCHHPVTDEIWMQFIHPEDRGTVQANFRAAVLEGRDSYQSEFRMLHALGHYLSVLGRGCILRNAQGRAIRTSGTNQDLTEQQHARAQIAQLQISVESLQDEVMITHTLPRKSAERALYTTTQRLSLALEASGLGLWTNHLALNEALGDANWHGMLGEAPCEAQVPLHDWLKRVHPDDQQLAGDDSLTAALSSNLSFEKTFRMRHAQGHWVWIKSRGKVIERDTAGKPLMMIGTHMDVSAEVRAQQRSDERNEQLLRCLEHLNVGIILHGFGIIKFVNTALLRIFGREEISDMVGNRFSQYILPDDLPAANWRQKQLMAGATLPTYWFNFLGTDGQAFKALTHSTLIEWDGEPHILSTMTPPGDSAMLMTEIESAKNRYEGLLARQLEEKQVHLAHELHDSLGAQLACISLQAAGIGQAPQDIGQVQMDLERLQGNISKAAATTRDLARGLMPINDWPGSFWRAMERLCHEFNNSQALLCVFEMAGNFEDIHADVGTHLYRITQEAIANAVRHGQATHIVVRLEHDGHAGSPRILRITDDGPGFDTAATAQHSGVGLASIYARARAIGAHVDLARQKPRGFCVEVRLPPGGLHSAPDVDAVPDRTHTQ